MHIDINCDLGESYGVYVYGADPEMMPLITSANVACGVHGGDPAVMRTSVELATSNGVEVGAHVGLDDRAGFGRREIPTTPQQAYDLCLYQMGALDAFIRVDGVRMQHVKPHGALYMMVNCDAALADALCRAVESWDPELYLYVLPGSELHRRATDGGLRVVPEAFADRPYLAGEVQMYHRATDLIGGPETVVARTLEQLEGPHGAQLRTVCLHSDTPGAPALLLAVRAALSAAGYSFVAPSRAVPTEIINQPNSNFMVQKGLV
jgi:UPF0271 protein